MERNYYPINETASKTAHDMMSFNEYKAGSKTAEYKGYVDRAYELADKIAEAKPNCADRAYCMADRYSKKMAEYFNKDFRIVLLEQCGLSAKRVFYGKSHAKIKYF